MSLRFAPIYFITILAAVTLAYALGFNIVPYQFDQVDPGAILQAPGLEHCFGTDFLGRDILVRLIHGAQMSLSIALLTGLMALLIGTSLGTIAGYLGGFVEELIMKLIDFIYSLPDLLVLSIIALFFSQSSSGIILGLAFISWMDLARLVRSEVKQIKAEEFIEATRTLGLNHWQIISKHILPNAVGSIIVALSFTLPRAILAESTLSFIGLGLSPPNTSWGTLAGDGWQYLRTDPHLIFFPALMIFLTVYSFNYFGDRLQESFNPNKFGEHLLNSSLQIKTNHNLSKLQQ
ncbi:MAG: ABC transporter permease [Cyanobacteria bacterium]|nr:ABC transporter permease [Cyanobacteriota bacterium]MDA1020832.1 ABC transporter permease [Cyanobacteriota bacterium]